MVVLEPHFPELTEEQRQRFSKLEALYKHWNEQINVISRKDVNHFAQHHLLHSLGIAKVVQFDDSSRVIDVGTGGGFPGIPLAILFPKVTFHLIDSIGKKINVVNAVIANLQLANVETTNSRVEDLSDPCDYVVSRAVKQLDVLYDWVQPQLRLSNLKNRGLYVLKGGDLSDEIRLFNERYPGKKVSSYSLSSHFKDPFFETKKVLHVAEA